MITRTTTPLRRHDDDDDNEDDEKSATGAVVQHVGAQHVGGLGASPTTFLVLTN